MCVKTGGSGENKDESHRIRCLSERVSIIHMKKKRSELLENDLQTKAQKRSGK